MDELLAEIIIPKYIRSYVRSKSIRAKYYERGKKEIPLKYCNKAVYKTQGTREIDPTKVSWQAFPRVIQGKKKMLEFLIDNTTGERIVANSNLVGQVNEKNINGQAIYNGNVARHDRNNMLGHIKDELRTYMESLKPIQRFPVKIAVYLFDCYHDETFSNGQDWDLLNRFFPYAKAIEDTLVELKIIPDDHRGYVSVPPYVTFVRIDDVNNRKLIIRIYKDNRKTIVENLAYRQLHGDKLK